MTTLRAPRASPLGNTRDRYGVVTKAFHWTIAAAILVMIPLGIVANDLPYDTSEQVARKAVLFSVHKTLGVAILLVALARIAWAVSQPKPGHLHPERRLETALADTVHWLLYASLVLVPLAGWVSHAASEGFAPIWWPLGQSLPLVPTSDALYRTASSLHVVLERVLVVSLLLHVAGALKHHFWDRDATLRRMAPGGGAMPAVEPHRASWLPPAAAAATLVAAVGVGAALGLYGTAPVASAAVGEDQAVREVAAAEPAARSEATAPAWTVEEGTLAIAVQQLGSRVEGSFAAWDATIEFDVAPGASGTLGRVEVAVDVASLTLGSVTSQAMGADFFAADSFPRAVFAARVLEAPEGSQAAYLAEGTLSLRGAEVPVVLPFDLSVEGDRAVAEGVVSVDRRDFAIGESYGDPGTLAFEVEIAVELEATRAE